MLDKLEKKIGKIAIPNLMAYIIGAYVVGYILQVMSSMRGDTSFLELLTLEPYMIIHHLQLWRLISWVLIPPTVGGGLFGPFFAFIMCFFYWRLGTNLEQTWGTFRFNLYIFGGLFFTLAGAFIFYFAFLGYYGIPIASMGYYFSTNYINMSIFLAFALTIPDMQVLLYFILPIKMKWLAVVYAVLMVYSFALTNAPGRVAIASSLLNFGIFYLANRKKKWSYRSFRNRGRSQGQSYGQGGFNRGGFGQGPFTGGPYGQNSTQGQNTAQRQSPPPKAGAGQISRHRCAVCGRTELTHPQLEFRFCSKCNGNYEYCSDHLFSHTHVE